MTRVGTATITAVDRKAGTIMLDRAPSLEPDTLFMHPSMFAALKSELSDFEFSIRGEPMIFGVTRTADCQRLAGIRFGKRGELTTAGVVALATFCALEWLRHRKHEVAAAEASGDYTTLIAEFVAWLRALLVGWREKIGAAR